MDLQIIEKNFFPDLSIYRCEKNLYGNINKSYILYTSNDKKYLLQKINTIVFNDPVAVMNNAVLISEYLKNKGKTCLEYIYSIDGKPYFEDEHKNFWRVMKFFPHTISYSRADDTIKAYRTGVAYGTFYKNLSDFSIDTLSITIKDFHNKKKRFEDLKQSFETTDRKRPHEFLLLSKMIETILNDKAQINNMPLRVTHNDTKIDNLLFDETTGACVAVVDMDTVMPGYIIDDFGDAARSVASTTDENEKNLNLICFDLEKFDAFANGFLNKTAKIMTLSEKKALFYGIASITAELACRFLTDYFNHDIYFNIQYHEHNFVRALNQITLLKDILLKQGEIKKIIEKNCK